MNGLQTMNEKQDKISDLVDVSHRASQQRVTLDGFFLFVLFCFVFLKWFFL